MTCSLGRLEKTLTHIFQGRNMAGLFVGLFMVPDIAV
jgi:hypothetical protein